MKDEIKKEIQNLKARISELEKQAEEEFKVGDWVVNTVCNNSSVHYITRTDGIYLYVEWNGKETKLSHKDSKNNRHATNEEIQAHLKKEADKRGFKNGITYIDSQSNEQAVLQDFDGLTYYAHNDNFTDGWGGAICYDGKWAEIIEDKIMIDKYEVRFSATGIEVGGKLYGKEWIGIFLGYLHDGGFISVITKDCSGKEIRVEKSTIEKIYQRLK